MGYPLYALYVTIACHLLFIVGVMCEREKRLDAFYWFGVSVKRSCLDILDSLNFQFIYLFLPLRIRNFVFSSEILFHLLQPLRYRKKVMEITVSNAPASQHKQFRPCVSTSHGTDSVPVVKFNFLGFFRHQRCCRCP